MRLRAPMLLLSLLVMFGAHALTFTHLAGSPGGTGTFDGIGSAARFAGTRGIASDAAGNLYVVDAGSGTVRTITPAGEVRTLAGTAGLFGTAMDAGWVVDGFGARARFQMPQAVTVDGTGNVYVTDYYQVRKITPSGAVTTLFGGLDADCSIAVDGAGNFYWDSGSSILKRSTTGQITTFVDGHGGVFNDPAAIAFDASTNSLLVADARDHVIRRVTIPGAVVTTVAGTSGTAGHVNGNGLSAQFDYPTTITVAADGRAWIGEVSGRIRTLSVLNEVGDAAGLGTGTADGDGTAARFRNIAGLTWNAADGKVYVSDEGNYAIRKLDGSTVTTFAGAMPLTGSADGTGAGATFQQPAGLASITSAGGTELYVSDVEANVIRKVTVPAGVVTTFAGSGTAGSADGAGIAASFFHPQGLAADPATGTLYVADNGNNTIRAINAAGEVSLYAGAPSLGSYENGDRLTAARFYLPTALAIHADRLYVADGPAYAMRLRFIDLTSGIVSDFLDSATGQAVSFETTVENLSVDSTGTVWVGTDGQIFRITQAGVRSVFAGHPLPNGSTYDGVGLGATFNRPGPRGLTIDGSGNGFVADGNAIRSITAAAVVTTIGGMGAGADDATGPLTRFRNPRAVLHYGTGGVLIAEDGGIRLGLPELPDVATIDAPAGRTGVVRQLGTAPETAASWEWSIVRKPAGSTASLSSASVRNPTFTPDIADLYIFRCVATNAGGSSITLVSFQANGPVTSLAFGLTLPATLPTAGVPFAMTVQARDSFGNNAVDFADAVYFAASDPAATPPADVTFTAADAGVKVVSGFVLRTVPGATLHAGVHSSALGVNTFVPVQAGPAASLNLRASPAIVRGGTPTAITLIVMDAFGNKAGLYLGTIHLTSNDPLATLPGDLSMGSSDVGLRNFDATFRSGGLRTLTATDAANGALVGSVSVNIQVPNIFGDQNNDGSSDIYWRNFATGANAVWLMNGTSFSGVVNLPALPNPNYRIAAIADFNHDGQADVVWRDASTGANAIWLMQNTAVLTVVNLPALANPAYAIGGTGDFNADGNPDLLWRNGTTGDNAIWLLNGTNIVSVVNLPALPNAQYGMEGAADFSGDGKPDILWRNPVTGANAVWVMNGTSFDSVVNLPALPNGQYRVGAVADFNGDLHPDIAWRNPATGANAIWTLNGTNLLTVVNLPGLTGSAYGMGGPR